MGPPYGICLAYANWACRVPHQHPPARPCSIGICQAYPRHGVLQQPIDGAPFHSQVAYAKHMPGVAYGSNHAVAFAGGICQVYARYIYWWSEARRGVRVHTPLGMAYVGHMTGICQVISVDISTVLTIPSTPMSALAHHRWTWHAWGPRGRSPLPSSG